MIKFEDLLAAVGFDFEVKKDTNFIKLYLIDKEDAYLGGKDSYETEIDPTNLSDAVHWALGRLDNYWHDSIVKEIIESVKNAEHKTKLEALSGYYPDMLKYIADNEITVGYDNEIKMLEAICNPKTIDTTQLTQKVDEVNEYIIPVEWSVCSSVVVKGAKNLQNAVELARKYADDIPLPNNAEYIDGSFAINVDSDEEAEAYQDYPMRGAMLDVRSEKPEYYVL